MERSRMSMQQDADYVYTVGLEGGNDHCEAASSERASEQQGKASALSGGLGTWNL